jgi:N6-adenosine-specific RNA methylase IME4
LLVGAKGALPPPAEAVRVPSVIRAARGRHSAKPEAVYQMLESDYPELRKLELFARTRRAGWEAWGNQAEGGG